MEMRRGLGLAGCSIVFAVGCTGDTGATGPQGPAGEDGASAAVFEVSGTLTGADGPVAGSPLFLAGLDTKGEFLGNFGGGVTDENGEFVIGLAGALSPSAQIMVYRGGSDGKQLLAALSSTTGLQVNLISTGVMDEVWDFVNAENARSLAAFSAEEMAELYSIAAETLTADGTDLADWNAVVDAIDASIGELVAEYGEDPL